VRAVCVAAPRRRQPPPRRRRGCHVDALPPDAACRAHPSCPSPQAPEIIINGGSEGASSSALSKIGIGERRRHEPGATATACATPASPAPLSPTHSPATTPARARAAAGENAPKPPNLLAVPIQRRPLFPGFMAPLVVTDEALVEAMIALKKTPSPFVGVFLVKDSTVRGAATAVAALRRRLRRGGLSRWGGVGHRA
jgi:hypothetical protein